MSGPTHPPGVPLFTYNSPMRRWGLIFVGGGAALLAGAMWLFVKGFVDAALSGAGVGAILSSFFAPLVLVIVAIALIVGGGTGLFVSWFGPSSLDDYEGPGDDVIWGRCPRCGWRNERYSASCIRCGRALPPPKSIW